MTLESPGDAISRAKAKIPKRYYDQTWLTSKDTLTTALGVGSDAAHAQVFVLDAQGRVAAMFAATRPTSHSTSFVPRCERCARCTSGLGLVQRRPIRRSAARVR